LEQFVLSSAAYKYFENSERFDRFVDWFRDLGFLQKPGVETKAARDVAAFVSQPERAVGQGRDYVFRHCIRYCTVCSGSVSASPLGPFMCDDSSMRNLLLLLLAIPACMFGQDNPLSTAIKVEYGMAKGVITRSADKVPEALYGFKPTDDVRSFGHWSVTLPMPSIFSVQRRREKRVRGRKRRENQTSKADLVQALRTLSLTATKPTTV